MKNYSLISVLFLFTSFYTFVQGCEKFEPEQIRATQFDVGVSALDLQKWIPDNEAFIVVSGKVRNYGVQPISSFWVSYQVDGGEILSYKETGFTLNQNKEQPFVHPDTFEPVLGNHILKVWTSLPNGQEDENHNNDTLTFLYTVYNAFLSRSRTILLEAFTSSTCGPCLYGSMNLKKVLEENEGKYALIKYQMGFPGAGDPYYTSECGTKGAFYGVTGIPAIHMEGSAFNVITSLLKNSDLLSLQNVPAFMEVNVDYYVEGQTVYTQTNIIPTIEFSGENLRLYLAIVEKKTYNNIGTNGETEFEDVMKKFVPDVNGVALENLTVNTPLVILQSWEFKGNYRLPTNAGSQINHEIEHSVENFDNLTVVAWVQDAQSGIVYQAANGVEVSNFAVTSSAFPADITLFPNPFSDAFTITNAENIREITMTNIFGQVVKKRVLSGTNTIMINAHELPTGFYLIKILTTGGEKRVYKIIKQR
jgi:hypothetical protein